MDRTKDLIEFWRSYFAAIEGKREGFRRYETWLELEAAYPSLDKEEAFYAYNVAASEQDSKKEDEFWEEIQRIAQRKRSRAVPEDAEMAERDANFLHNAEEPERLFNAFLATLKRE
jgi:hypothetical protein